MIRFVVQILFLNVGIQEYIAVNIKKPLSYLKLLYRTLVIPIREYGFIIREPQTEHVRHTISNVSNKSSIYWL